MVTEFDFEQFRKLSQAYGANRARWPQEAHPLYDRFANTPEAQLLLASAQQVDHFLDQWQLQVREDEVAARILHTLPPQVTQPVSVRQWSLPAAVMMLIALLGFSNGFLSTDLTETLGPDMPAAFGMAEEE